MGLVQNYFMEQLLKHPILKEKLIFDLRMNNVGKRKVQKTNILMRKYENEFVPSYTKFKKDFTTQLSVNNLFNKQYYGIRREIGFVFINDYRKNPNPNGYIPIYQP